MGKRKSKTKVITKKKDNSLAKTFQCIFCQHEGAVSVTFSGSAGGRVGRLQCKVCDEKFNAPVSKMAQEIDVYSIWVDDTEEVNSKRRIEESE